MRGAASAGRFSTRGPPDARTSQTITQLAERHTSLVTVHHLTVQNTPGTLHDPDGQALRRLGLTARHTAQYLVRPDGHIGYRAGGTDVTGLARYLSRWLPGPQTTSQPFRQSRPPRSPRS